MNDPHNLQRFVDAQDRVFDQVCSELREGRKRSHWMWFIFPQIEGLGHSHIASKYAIDSARKRRPTWSILYLGRGCENAPGS